MNIIPAYKKMRTNKYVCRGTHMKGQKSRDIRLPLQVSHDPMTKLVYTDYSASGRSPTPIKSTNLNIYPYTSMYLSDMCTCKSILFHQPERNYQLFGNVVTRLSNVNSG